jgi:hypothetical protein
MLDEQEHIKEMWAYRFDKGLLCKPRARTILPLGCNPLVSPSPNATTPTTTQDELYKLLTCFTSTYSWCPERFSAMTVLTAPWISGSQIFLVLLWEWESFKHWYTISNFGALQTHIMIASYSIMAVWGMLINPFL